MISGRWLSRNAHSYFMAEGHIFFPASSLAKGLVIDCFEYSLLIKASY